MNIKDEYGQFRFNEPEKRRHGIDMNCKIILKQKQNLMAEAPWLAPNPGSSGRWEAARVTNQPFKFSKKEKKSGHLNGRRCFAFANGQSDQPALI